MAQNTENVTVRMSSENQKKLDHIATTLERSRNWIINEAVGHYLDIYTWQENKIRERLQTAQKKGKFHTAKEVADTVESFKA